MSKYIWGVPAAIWLLFTLWYTDLGGPLSEKEVSEAMAYFEGRGGPPEQVAMLRSFFEEDTGRQFFMVNNIDMNDVPPPMAGYGADATAADYMNHYMEHMYVQLLSRASHPVFFGSVVAPSMDIVGIDGAEIWDQVGLMRYRSRRTFLDIVTHPDMNARHDYKVAALTKTIAYPVETGIYLSDPRFLLALMLGLVAALVDRFMVRR